MTELASVFEPLKDGDYQTNVAIAHGDVEVNSTNYIDSGILALTGLYNKRITPLGDTKAENDPINFDGSNQFVTWYAVNQHFYKFPYDPTKTFEHASRETEKFIYYSASIFSIPYAKTGEKIRPGSVTLTTGDSFLVDDSIGNMRDFAILTSSFAPINNLVAYWGFNEQYKRIVGNFGSYNGSVYWTSKTYAPDQTSNATNVNFQPGVEVYNGAYTSSGIAATFEVPGIINTLYDEEKFKYAKDDDFAISFWVKAPVSQSNVVKTTNSLINNRGTTYEMNFVNFKLSSSYKPVPANAYAWDLNIQNQTSAYPNRILARRSDGTYSTAISSSTIITGSVHHHVVYQKTGSAIQLYVNGVLENSTTDNLRDNPINTSNVFIGALNTTFAESFSGSIDEVRIYNTGLTQTQISSLANRHYLSGSLYQTNVAGNAFYRSGMVVISHPLPKYNNIVTGTWALSLQSTHRVHETEVTIRIPKDKYNYSFNPTLLKAPNSDELIDDLTTGSLTPYITTIGLYNEFGQLLAVGKLGAPLQKRTDIDTTIIIRWDS